jgi:TetR/AcrR family transcriptional regulator, transcriptional repressor for nem operon
VRALAAEVFALPEEMRPPIKAFFSRHEEWLARLVKRGVTDGEFRRITPPEKMAHTIFSSLQGSLLVRRTAGEPVQTAAVIATRTAMLVQRD